MSDLEEPGWPRIEPTGGSVAGALRASSRDFGAWECLLLALSKPLPESKAPRGVRRYPCGLTGNARACPHCGRRARGRPTLDAPERRVTPESTKWARHTVDAVRILVYGLDTLYAGGEDHAKSYASSIERKPRAKKSTDTVRPRRPRVRDGRAA